MCPSHLGPWRPCWVVDVGSCGDMSGQRWDHIGLIMAYLEPFWATLGPYWAHDEPFWAVCWPLSCQKHCKCPEKTALLGCVADVFDAMLNYIFSFLLGHAALRLCWPYLKLMLSKNSIHVGLLLRPLEPMLGRCRAVMSGHCLCQLCSVGCCCVLVKDGVTSACQ